MSTVPAVAPTVEVLDPLVVPVLPPQLAARIAAIAAIPRTLRIVDEPTHHRAVLAHREAKSLVKEISSYCAPAKQRALEITRLVRNAEAAAAADAEAVVAWCNSAIPVYEREERRRAEDARRAAEAIARKIEEDKRIAEAEELQKRGLTEAAETVLETEDPAPVVHTAPPAVSRVEGRSTRKLHRARVVNRNLVPDDERGFWRIDDQVLGEFARRTKGVVPVPGVEFYFEEIPVDK